MRLLLFLLFTLDLMAGSVDQLLLKAQAGIFPKIMLLDKDIQNKLQDNKLVLGIVYTKREKRAAEQFKEMLKEEHKNRLGGYRFEARMIDIVDFDADEDVSAYYIFGTGVSEVSNVVSNAVRKKRICFSYNYRDFANNVLIGLFVKEKTYIYLNKSALQAYNIKFIPIFYKIVKVI